jgi:hypothetical protein
MFSTNVRPDLRSYLDFMTSSQATTWASLGSAIASTQRSGKSPETRAHGIVVPGRRAGE